MCHDVRVGHLRFQLLQPLHLIALQAAVLRAPAVVTTFLIFKRAGGVEYLPVPRQKDALRDEYYARPVIEKGIPVAIPGTL
jgi:hypothetical protein